jgi:hypothetical protein
MQILRVLKQDHEEVQELLGKIMQTGGMKTRQRLFEKTKRALLAHAHAEQATFYKALEEHDESFDEALEAEVEHELIERIVADLSEPNMDPERWSAKCKVLRDLFEHHVKEEERKMFRIARQIFDRSTLQALGERFEAAKKEQLQQVA